jgi:hypothetical protein
MAVQEAVRAHLETEAAVIPTLGKPTTVVNEKHNAKAGEIVLVDPTLAAFTVVLPRITPQNLGQYVIVKEVGGSANTITVLPGDANATIDGSASAALVLPRGTAVFQALRKQRGLNDALWGLMWEKPIPVYGGISVVANGNASVIAGAGTYVQFTEFDTDDPAALVTPAHSTDDLTIQVPGTYLIMFTANCEVTQNDQVHMEAKKNNGATSLAPCHSHTTGLGAGLKQALSGMGAVSLSIDDTVELWLANDTSADDITIEDACLTVERLGA